MCTSVGPAGRGRERSALYRSYPFDYRNAGSTEALMYWLKYEGSDVEAPECIFAYWLLVLFPDGLMPRV